MHACDNTPYEKIGNDEPVSIADELPFEIPETWEWVRLGQVIVLLSGTDFRPDEYNNQMKGIPYITGASSLSLDEVIVNRWTESPRVIANRGDVLLVCKGSGYGKTVICDIEEAHIARQIMAIKEQSMLDMQYIRLFLQANSDKIKSKGQGVIPGIDRDSVLKLLFPLPPLNEQHQIVARIAEVEALLSSYDLVEQQLSNLQDSFPEQLKKSILQMAVQGKLVPQDPADEPASVLLERIRAEKHRLIKEGKIKKDKHESVIFRRDNSHYEKCGSIETCIDDIIPFEVPGNWIWVRLGTLIEEKPSNGYSPKGVPYSTNVKNLTLSATTSGYFKSDAYKYVDIEIPSDSKYWLKHNDILIQRGNSRELVGTACIYTGKDNEFIYPDLMMRIRAMNRIDIRYLDLVLKAPFSRRYFTSSASGTSDSMPKINQTIVTNTFVPLPDRKSVV